MRDDKWSRNTSFSTRNTPFSDLWPWVFGNLGHELDTIGAGMIGASGVRGLGWGAGGGKGNARSARLNTNSGHRADLYSART